MISILYICHQGLGANLSLLIVTNSGEKDANLIVFEETRDAHINVMYVICSLWTYFTGIELMQIYKNGLDYIKDPWNFIDSLT